MRRLILLFLLTGKIAFVVDNNLFLVYNLLLTLVANKLVTCVVDLVFVVIFFPGLPIGAAVVVVL